MKRVGTHLVGADSWDTWATGWLAAMKLYKDAGNPDLELDCLDYERGDCWSPALLMNVAEFRAEYFCVQPGIICPGDAGDTNLLAVLAATADAAVVGGGTGQRFGGVKPGTSVMPGALGTQHTSKTYYENGRIRLDSENPKPGERPGQIHIQIQGIEGKFQWDFASRRFDQLPDWAANQLRGDIQRWGNSLDNALSAMGDRPVRRR